MLYTQLPHTASPLIPAPQQFIQSSRTTENQSTREKITRNLVLNGMAYYLYKKIRQKQKQRKDVEPWAETYPLEYQRVTSPNSGGSADQRQREDRTSTKRHDRNRDASSLREDKKAKRKYRWQLIGGLMLPFITYGLNTTMIAGALPFIASDFRESSLWRHSG